MCPNDGKTYLCEIERLGEDKNPRKQKQQEEEEEEEERERES